MRVNLEACYILHQRSFNETSVILDALSLGHGRISLLARGVRATKSRWRGLLRPFTPLLISWSGKTELMSVSAAEPAGAPFNLEGTALLSGLYINELVIRLLPRHDIYSEVFRAYSQVLAMLQSPQHEAGLRYFEKTLLAELGYGFSLEKETSGRIIAAEHHYAFIPGHGFSQCTPDQDKYDVFSGKSLLALHHDRLEHIDDLRAAKRLTRQAISHLLAGKPLRSREIFYTAGSMDLSTNS
jgi:DNA repair protein RecO (recombination protein O)